MRAKMIRSCSTIVALALLAGVRLPAQFPASRFLPEDRTLMCLELAPPEVLLAHRGKIVQLGLFDTDPVRRFLEFGAGEDPKGSHTIDVNELPVDERYRDAGTDAAE